MNIDLLFDSKEEREATEKVLATFKIQSLNEEIDELVANVLEYAKEMDNLLEENNIPKRFLDKVSSLSENDDITLDSDLNNIDFRIREVLEDKVKRINTRLSLIRNNNLSLKSVEERYNLTDFDLEEGIKIAKLRQEDFV